MSVPWNNVRMVAKAEITHVGCALGDRAGAGTDLSAMDMMIQSAAQLTCQW